MAKNTIDELYISLGLDLDAFERDFVAADRAVRDAVNKLNREQRLAKLRMDIDLSAFDDANKSAQGLAMKMDHLNRLLQNQRQLVSTLTLAYQGTAKVKGEDAAVSQRLLERLTKEQKQLAELERQYRLTAAERNKLTSQAMVPVIDAAQATSSVNAALGAVRGAWAQMAALLGTTFSVKWFIDINSQAEKLQLQYRVLLQDSQKAAQALAEIKKFADVTPFKTQEVTEAGKMLFTAGLTDYKRYLSLAGDWAAATGRNITEIAAVFARIQSWQFGEAMERMRELSISAQDLMAEGIRFSSGGEILNSVDEVMSAVERIIRQRFGGMTDELSRSWEGVWSTFVSNVEDAAREMSGGFFTELRDSIAEINKELDKLKGTGFWRDAGQAIGGSLNLLGLVRNKIVETYDAWTGKVKEVTDASEQSAKAAEEQAKAIAKAQADAIKEAIKYRDEAIRNLDLIKKVQDTENAVARARRQNAVDVAGMEYIQAAQRLARLEAAEAEVKARMEAAGKQYMPTSTYLDAQKDAAEKLTKLYDEQIKAAETLGQFVYASQKLLAEAEAIDAVGGDSRLKRFEALKQAVTDYLSELDKLRKAEIDATLSPAILSAALKAAEQMTVATAQNSLSVLAVTERQYNLERLRERMDVIRRLLESEQFGHQQRRQLIEEEQSVFAQYIRGLSDGIQDAMSKIQSLQAQVMSSASQTADILQRYFPTQATSGMREIASVVTAAWNATTQHSLEQISQVLALRDRLAAAGVSLGISVSYDDVMRAFRASASSSLDAITKIKDGLAALVAEAKNAGKLAADNFFASWHGYINDLRTSLGSLAVPEVGRLPAFAAGSARGSGTINISVSVPVTAQVNTDADIERLADRVAGVIARDIKRELGGGDYGY